MHLKIPSALANNDMLFVFRIRSRNGGFDVGKGRQSQFIDCLYPSFSMKSFSLDANSKSSSFSGYTYYGPARKFVTYAKVQFMPTLYQPRNVLLRSDPVADMTSQFLSQLKI